MYNIHSKHVNTFLPAADGEDVHKLEYTAAHNEFLSLYESVLEKFLSSEGATMEQFYAECQGSLNDDYCALFEEDKYKWFVNLILSTMEYDSFFTLMKNEAKMYRRQHPSTSESKVSGK